MSKFPLSTMRLSKMLFSGSFISKLTVIYKTQHKHVDVWYFVYTHTNNMSTPLYPRGFKAPHVSPQQLSNQWPVALRSLLTFLLFKLCKNSKTEQLNGSFIAHTHCGLLLGSQRCQISLRCRMNKVYM